MRENPRIFTPWIAVALALFLGWQLGSRFEAHRLEQQYFPKEIPVVSGSGVVLTDPARQANISLLWTTWRSLLRYYVEPQALQEDALVQGAAEGLVRAVGDPYTVFMNSKDSTEFRRSLTGELQGIGAELKEKDHYITVVVPLKGSPAERAGLKAGDIITGVDGTPVDGLSLSQVVSRIRGPKGTSVALEIYREGEAKPLTITIVRDTIRIPSVESSVIANPKGPFGHVILSQFGDKSIAEVKAALEDLTKKNVRGIILDLRGNGGGYLEGAVDLTSFFVNKGRVVSVERRDVPIEHHEVTGNAPYPAIPLVVLINEGSASASEIVAGALQDNGRAKIVGMTSYGKGTVQEIVDLPGGNSLRVTVAHWVTPKGKNLGKEGVHPDTVADRTTKDFEEEKDPQLDAAVKVLAEQKN